MKAGQTFNAPLHPLDTEKQTFGCRHTNPDICGKNAIPSVCAFVRPDNVCLAPSTSWPKQFIHLKTNAGAVKRSADAI